MVGFLSLFSSGTQGDTTILRGSPILRHPYFVSCKSAVFIPVLIWCEDLASYTWHWRELLPTAKQELQAGSALHRMALSRSTERLCRMPREKQRRHCAAASELQIAGPSPRFCRC